MQLQHTLQGNQTDMYRAFNLFIYEVCESNYYECNTKDEVENYKEKSVVEKADLIIKKDKKDEEIMRKKKRKYEKWESTV